MIGIDITNILSIPAFINYALLKFIHLITIYVISP